MASISLYDENQLCRIISPAGVSNQLFYVHEVPEAVKCLTNDPNPKIKLELYPIVERNETQVNKLDVESLIFNENCNEISFDFGKLFNRLFGNKQTLTDIDFISSFENSSNFKLSTVKMSEVNATGIEYFNKNYPNLSSDYLKSHMYDTFRNAAIESLSNKQPENSSEYLVYNMVLAWTKYIESIYEEYVNIVWNLVNKKFNVNKLNYEWSPSSLLNSPVNVSSVITKTLKYEQIERYLTNEIASEDEYIKVKNNNDEKLKFNYAINSVYILISKQIGSVVDDFNDMLNNHADFNFGYDLTSTTITTNFKSWLSGITDKLVNINTKYFDNNVVKTITDGSLVSLKETLTYKYFVDKWTIRFSKNVDLISNNSEKIDKNTAKEFYEHLNSKRYVDDWEEYYKSLEDIFIRIINEKSKTLKDDLFNDLVVSIAYDEKDLNLNRIQRQFYQVLGEYNKKYSIAPKDITEYLKTLIDDKRILQAAIEKRFSEYEFKNILSIIKGNTSNIINIIKDKDLTNIENNYYQNSSLYNKFISLFEIYNDNADAKNYFITFDKSIKLLNDKYKCDFKTDLKTEDITVQLDNAFNPNDNMCETVFSSDSETDYLFNEIKINGYDLISNNISSTIDTLNKIEVKYLHKLLSDFDKEGNYFTELQAQAQYNNYYEKYSNKFMLFEISDKKIEDFWRKSFNLMIDKNATEIVPENEFASRLTNYYESVIIPNLNSIYLQYNNSSIIYELQSCINNLTSYLYDVDCYGKKSGFSNNYAQKTIIIDSVLNRSITFNVPMKLNNNDELYIYQIIESLESKVRELETRELTDEMKKEEFDKTVTAYQETLQRYVDGCANEQLEIAIQNYYSLKNENIPNEYQSSVFTKNYYKEGKTNLTNNSFNTLLNGKDNIKGIKTYISELKSYIDGSSEYDNSLITLAKIFYNGIKDIFNNYEDFLISEGFNTEVNAVKDLEQKIEDYDKKYKSSQENNDDSNSTQE